MRYYLIAGEASGDLHGSNLIRGLKAEDAEAEFRFWGGEMMCEAALQQDVCLPQDDCTQQKVCTPGGSNQDQCPLRCIPSAAAGIDPGLSPLEGTHPAADGEDTAVGSKDSAESILEGKNPAADGQYSVAEIQPQGFRKQNSGRKDSPLVRHYKEGAVMGLTDVFAKAGKLIANIKYCEEDILAWKPDVVILIDYPGFNMRIAEFCHRRGIKVFYYIAPKTWASRESRNRKLKAYVDKLFIVFPFEIPYFTEKGIPFEYRGNPLVDAVDNHRYTRPVDGKYIAVLAGSRKGEISRMMPVCVEIMERLHSDPDFRDYRFVIAGAPARSAADYEPYLKPGQEEYVSIVFGRTYDVLKFADAAVINSGTASLEAVLTGTPQVVCWSTSPLTAVVARYLFRIEERIKYISLGNLCIDRLAFKELVQEKFTADNVCEELHRLILDPGYRAGMLSDYAEIRESLGSTGASRAVARAMINSL